MYLKRLRISSVRNLKYVAFKDLAPVNVLVGPNGSGKTSVLESIHVLSTSKSFRQVPAKSLITWGEPSCTVFGELEPQNGGACKKYGVQRSCADKNIIKIDGNPVKSAAELARSLPVHVLDSETLKLLSGGPATRRRFIDWGVFHVEHDYQKMWLEMERCIKHRNSLLRHDRIDLRQFDLWTEQFIERANYIDTARQRYLRTLRPKFDGVLAALSSELEGVELIYARGWDKRYTLAECLESQQQSERDRKHTMSGPQRADLKVRFCGKPAEEVLSRGQKKLVACSLKLAQAELCSKADSGKGLFLIDDLPAELDIDHRFNLYNKLLTLGTQLFVTCTDADEAATFWQAASTDKQRIRMFHVEQGSVSNA